jgi:hypothetical protein
MTVRIIQCGTSHTNTMTCPFALKRYATTLLTKQTSLLIFLKPNETAQSYRNAEKKKKQSR